MNGELEKVHARLGELEQEIMNLRQGYVIVNKRYTEALGSLKELTTYATEAAKRAADAAAEAVEWPTRPPHPRRR